MPETATLTLADGAESNPGGSVEHTTAAGQIYAAPSQSQIAVAMMNALASYTSSRMNAGTQKLTKAVLVDLFGRLTPADRQDVDDSFRPQGFLNTVANSKLSPEVAMEIGRRLHGADDVLVTNPPNPVMPNQASGSGRGGCRGCGCGTPGCNKGGAAKLSPGFLAKVKKHLKGGVKRLNKRGEVLDVMATIPETMERERVNAFVPQPYYPQGTFVRGAPAVSERRRVLNIANTASKQERLRDADRQKYLDVIAAYQQNPTSGLSQRAKELLEQHRQRQL